jgi:hypothetical protein
MNSCQSRRQAHNARNQCNGYKPSGGRVSCTTTTTTEPKQKTKWIYYNSFLLEALLQLSWQKLAGRHKIRVDEQQQQQESKKASKQGGEQVWGSSASYLPIGTPDPPVKWS